MSDLQQHCDEWLALAAEADNRAAWDVDARPAATHQAEAYRSVARALEIEMQTGVAVCSCCFKPFSAGMRI